MKSLALTVIALIIGLVIGYFLGIYSTPQPAATTTTPQTTQTPQCRVSVDAIKKRGKLIVGTDATWPPWEWVMGNQIVGWDVDIAREIANALGVQLELRDMRFAGLLEAVRNGDVDLAISAITWTTEREKVLEFSMPYYLESIVVVTKASRTDINKVEDLYGKTVGVQIGTTHEEWAATNLEKPGKASVRRYDKVYPYMVEVLRRGDVDAIILDRSIATALVRKFPDLKIAFELPGSAGYISVAMPKCAQDLKLVVNQVIENLIQTGKLDQIMQKNFELFLQS
ncbi:ABC transporter substrate-binding protein [Pyrobaculum aerophilum]|uniref:Bacterial extracellular solute-binding proteins, family 3 n=2 Tax=Pyrobaculum aerophilum TaxID=13773 RepID=Q8ZVW2_PYRAE|nr:MULTISPECIES: ABC transporter substrate-binding protein [Pyrobaculum]AAL63942.1 bacterial extracellular solute-binding proteins, family 3 [Pyrobaculum aerophilum str. IM2]MCX8137523.1 ABC transporter substrate-binding protein [Pyrobaculum aerophilum]HII46496.1 amino acid ABC transporter substrate-binding protein [Pyrobaculum aerophilum]